MSPSDPLRAQLVKFLNWEDAHVSFDKAVEGVPTDLRGKRPDGSPHSLWELVEHIRVTQHDILSFCRKGKYVELEWPKEYWPATPTPPSDAAWSSAIAAMREDRAELQAIAADPAVDLFALVPHGAGEQTFMREMLMVVDHGSYHIGQIVTTRHLLGIWPAS
jgi:uncharacterized damage-inducible protein DinB